MLANRFLFLKGFKMEIKKNYGNALRVLDEYKKTQTPNLHSFHIEEFKKWLLFKYEEKFKKEHPEKYK